MDTAWLLWGSLFSLIGMAVFVYGRRQRQGVVLILGIALMVYPYFVSNVYVLIAVGAFLLAGLFVAGRLDAP